MARLDGLPERGTDRLLAVVARLRGPDGCPWDREQTVATVRHHLVGEVYEAMEALEAPPESEGGAAAAAEELGDLLFQIVFLAQLFAERGSFDFDTIARRAADKMIGRHPHVFGDRKLETAAEVLRNWSDLKAEQRGEKPGERSILDGIPRSLPALEKACELASRAAREGFDWSDPSAVRDKVHEELEELTAAQGQGDAARIAEEVGDVLFTVANLARKLDCNPEQELQRANAKFARRFRFIETRLRESGSRPSECPPGRLEELWTEAKRAGL